MTPEGSNFGLGWEEVGRTARRRRGRTPRPDTSGAAAFIEEANNLLAENERAGYEETHDYGPPEDVDYYQDPTRPAIPETPESGDPEIASRGGFDPEAPLGRPIDPEEY